MVSDRYAVLPQDISFQHGNVNGYYDLVSPKDFKLEVLNCKDFFNSVTAKYEVSTAKMQQQYNKNLRFVDYEPNEKV